ncbi:DUF6599 family protein [Parabacteroides sp. PF5-9]|uniref:DUF6599 family protein n=1 Tax=Parabacteroides sp. PF5-9 TaxID=1742404 RepID=UPI002476B84F|nr:DUF6599 family protein [Parabacteroides sp. PF5-9]MDH6358058.1 hypothetical protein [Parabacteroides sp. PF5-9]
MKKIFVFCFLFTLFSSQFSIVYCQLSITRERTFTGAGLYGFMNGGADQFLEYGVTSLVTRDVVFNEEPFTIDIYEMPTAEDAYGIYSIHVFRCQRADTLECINCLSPFQYQAVIDNKYVSVVFPSGSSRGRVLADELITHYLPTGKEHNPVFPEMLDLQTPYSGVLKYLRGSLSVSTASRSLTSLLKEYSYTGVWFYADKGSDDYYALIYFKDKEQIIRFKTEFTELEILKEGNDFLYFKGMELMDDTPDFGPFGF